MDRPGIIEDMEDAEREVKQMAVVAGTSLPEGWRLRPMTLAVGRPPAWIASVTVEKFDGAGWRTHMPAVVGARASSRGSSWAALLSAWSEKTEWTVDLGYGLEPLRIPPASSVEELCLKLDLTDG